MPKSRCRRASVLTRLWRYLCWWNNPLKRRVDRWEGVVSGLFVMLFIGTFPVAVIVARYEYSHGIQQARAVQSEVYESQGVLTANAPLVSGTSVITGADRVDVPGRWTDTAGHVRHGTVPVDFGARKGQTVAVWLDRRGNVVDPPVGRASVQVNSVALGACVVVVSAFVLEGCRWLLRRYWDKRRIAAWDAEWSRVGPQWTRRR